MAWVLVVVVLGYPGDETPRDIQRMTFEDARTCFIAENNAKAWGRENNLTVATGCHPTTEG